MDEPQQRHAEEKTIQSQRQDLVSRIERGQVRIDRDSKTATTATRVLCCCDRRSTNCGTILPVR